MMTKSLTLSLSQYKQYFPKIRICVLKNVFCLVQAILISRTVNLNKLKDELSTVLSSRQVSPHAHYTRLLRLFRYKKRLKLTQQLLQFNRHLLTVRSIKELALDRTQWTFGEQPINLLVLSYLHQGCSIPLCWIQLEKFASSSQEERIKLIQLATQFCNFKCACLLMDREFIGEKWLKYLHEQGLYFVLRLPKGTYKDWVNERGEKRYSKLHHIAKWGRRLGYTPIKHPYGRYLFVVMRHPLRCKEEPYYYFISNLKRPKPIPEKYLRRWTIETCFYHLKTNGFNLEQMHFKDKEKIELMMAIVVTAYCLAIQEGIIQVKSKKGKTKTCKRNMKTYPRISLFRQGLSYLKQKVYNLKSLLKYIQKVIASRKVNFFFKSV